MGETQFWDTYNLCSTNYPVMTPRARRATVRTISNPQGLYARGKLCWAAGNKLYYDGTQVNGVTLSNGAKTFVGMGAYIIVFPDGVRYNTYTGAVDMLAASFPASGTVTGTVTIARQDGTDYQNVTVSATAPSSPTAGDYWLDTGSDPAVLRVYAASAVWTAILTTFLRIEATGIGSAFKVGDAVTIDTGVAAADGTKEIVGKGTDWILVSGVMSAASASSSAVKAARTVPTMDFVCELNNRIWGCSNAKHEIYCCKLGDPTNWMLYGTNAGDAWAATVGSDGDFTGCCSYGGCALFWKEDSLHKVMGTKPSNFQIIDGPARGVQKGSEKSLCVVNEVLIYKSRDGVMMYDGATPTNIGQALGTERLYDARAGVDGDRYYISMHTEGGQWGLWVFNEAKGLWHREDGTRADDFAALDGQLYFLRHDGKLMAVRGKLEVTRAGNIQNPPVLEDPVDWWAETGDMLIEQAEYKYLARIQIKASVEQDSTMTIEAMYDSSGDWVRIYKRGKSRKAAFAIPMIPARCDHMRLRISGHGSGAVYGIFKQIENGGSEIGG